MVNAFAEEAVDDLFILKVAVLSDDYWPIVFLSRKNRSGNYRESRHAARGDVSGLGVMPRCIDERIAESVFVVLRVEVVVSFIVRGVLHDFSSL